MITEVGGLRVLTGKAGTTTDTLILPDLHGASKSQGRDVEIGPSPSFRFLMVIWNKW